jgi:hypothetical protein
VLASTSPPLRGLYDNSLHKLLTFVYPEYKWLPWKFLDTTEDVWKDANNVSMFIKEVERENSIKELNDWYKVTEKVNKKYVSLCLFAEN